MCGICGLYSPSDAPARRRSSTRCARAIAHRGPDQGSTDAFGACVLGHQRLAVLDPELGDQPVANETRRRRRRLQRRALQLPRAARELAARGHEVRGTRRHAGHPAPLRGVRASTSSSGSRDVRDRALGPRRASGSCSRATGSARSRSSGRALADGTLAFASELKAFHALPGLPREPDLAALDAYLALQYVPGTRTGLRGVQRLPPGSLLVVEDGREQVERYWEPRRRRRGRDATTSGSSACATR